jgi:hypothetical protein
MHTLSVEVTMLTLKDFRDIRASVYRIAGKMMVLVAITYVWYAFTGNGDFLQWLEGANEVTGRIPRSQILWMLFIIFIVV